jgi:hypothetical protein
MDNIDFNINNYNVDDLIRLFRLDGNISKNSLIENKMNFYNKILNTKELENNDKIKTLNFIDNAYNVLILNLDKKDKSGKLISNNTINNDITLKNLYLNENIDEKSNEITDVKDNNSFNGHQVVNKPYTKFIYTNPSSAFDGIMNPIEKRIITKVLCLDTRFRENFCTTGSNNLTFQLYDTLENVISMKLISSEIPRLWYSISSTLKNNTFKIYLYNMVDYPDNVQTIVLPDGNYNNALLVNVLNNYFTNIKNGLDYLRFDVNVSNSKSYFYVKSDPAKDSILPYDPANASYSPNFYYVLDFLNCEGLGLYLGYKNIKYEGNKSMSFTDNFFITPSVTYYGVISSESSCGSNIDNYVFIDVNDFNKNFTTNTIVSQKNNTFLGNNILGKIAATFPDSLILNNASDNIFRTREYYGPVKIKKLQIALLDKYGNIIDLLNNNFSLTLEFNILYN